jgi:DNA invertase Pin-like site-specific DNA recombinase
MEKSSNSPPLRAVGYRRVSMKDQVEGFSLDAQEVNITRYIESHGWELVDIYIDAGISAKKGSCRPAFEHLMKDAQAGNFDVVVVDKIDRFYRHLSGLLSTLDQLNSYGVSFASVQEQLDFTTPWGKLMLTVLGTLAEIYLDNLRQETRKGKLQRARQGFWLGEHPYGYCNGQCSQCTHPNGKDYCPDFGTPNKGDKRGLYPHPVEAQVVKMVFDWYAGGHETSRTIARRLNETSITLPNGKVLPIRAKGKLGRSDPSIFGRDVIRDMIKRVVYTGKLPYHGVDDNGRHRKRAEVLYLFPGHHIPLVDEATFARAQEIRKLNGAIFSYCDKSRLRRVYPLTGILHCSRCGAPMRGNSRVSGDQIHYHYADANRLDKELDCPQRLVRAERIEAQVVKWLQNQVAQVLTAENLEIQEQLQESEVRFSRAKDLFLASQIDRRTFDTESARHENLRTSLHADESCARIPLALQIQPQLDGWEDLSQFERKRLLRGLVERAYLRGNAFVAGQPTFAFQPLIRPYTDTPTGCDPLTAGHGGEGGIRTRG